MIEIPYHSMVIFISVLWILTRIFCFLRYKRFSPTRELQLLLVYICIIVAVRFTFCPFGKVDGKILPLLFDAANIFPFRLNLIPLVNLMDYEILQEAKLNLIGNIAMFIPIGIIWPAVFKELNSPVKVMTAGIGFSLCIEILQLPFFDRVTDIDDLILNSLGFAVGYLIWLFVKFMKQKIQGA